MSDSAGEAFVSMVNTQSSSLSTDVADHILGLSNSWAMAHATDEENARAEALANILLEHFSDRFAAMVEHWSGEALSGLSKPCLTWLAKNLASFDASERQTIMGSVSKEADDLSEEELSRYSFFMDALHESALGTDEVQKHLTFVAQKMRDAVPQQNIQNSPQIVSQVEKGREFLISILPIIAPKLQYADHESAAQMIQRVFGDASNISAASGDFAALHAAMAEHWRLCDKFDLYLEAVVDTACNCIEENPDEPETVVIFNSLVQLVQSTNLEAEAYGARLASAAALVWKHDIERVNRLLDNIPVAPEPDEIQRAVLSVAPESYSESMAPVRTAFEKWSKQLSVEDQATIIVQLLNTIEEDHPAEALIRAWLEATPDRKDVVFEVIQTPDIADLGLERLWLQMCQLTSEFGLEFFQQALKKLLGIAELNRTHEAIVANRESISRLTEGNGQTSKNSLAGALVESYLERAAGATVKGNILQWIRELRADDKIRDRGQEAFKDEELEQIKSELGSIWKR